MLTNHHATMAQFSWDSQPQCRCSSFWEKHPHIGGVEHPGDGQWHVASPLDALSVSKRLRFLLGTSAKTQVYPALSSYVNDTWLEIQRWAKRHFVPNVTFQDWKSFECDQWSRHTMYSRTPLSFDDIKYIKSVLDGFVAQGGPCSEPPAPVLSSFLLAVYSPSLLTPTQAKSVSGPVGKETLAQTISLGSAGNSEATLLLSAS